MRNDIQRLAFVAVLALTGCGTVDPEQAARQAARCEQSVGEEYFPLVDQVEWTYDVTDPSHDVRFGEKGNKILERDGDTIKLEVSGGLRQGVRWLKASGSRYAWTRNLFVDLETREPDSDQYYDPPALRFEWSHTVLDEPWQEKTYRKSTIDIALCPNWSASLDTQNLEICPAEAIKVEDVIETWTLVADEEALSSVQGRIDSTGAGTGVPAGDFTVRCLERKCDDEACTNGTYCFSRGVGKVYELSSEREELTSVCFPGHATP